MLKKKESPKAADPMGFMDLGNIPLDAEENPGTRIKITEIREFDDVPYIADMAYDGNILFIDCTAMATDKENMRKLSKELTAIAKDCNGDAVMMANRFIILSSGGIKIDRNRIKHGKRE